MPEIARLTTMWSRWLLRLAAGAAVAMLVLVVAVACGGDDDADDGQSGSISGDVTVFAASSLTDAFKEAGTAFEKKYPGTKVTFSFAASSALAVQINELAPADVFASADQAQMKAVTDKGNAIGPEVFVKNTPVVVVPNGSDAVAVFADLSKPDVKLVLAGATVPIGRYAREIFTKASSASGGISPDFATKALANLRSEEANVRAVLTKVQLGEADAGVVYKTDVGAAANDVKVIEIPPAYNVVAEYPIAVLKQAKNHAAAADFVTFIRSAEGAAIMEKYGFAKP